MSQKLPPKAIATASGYPSLPDAIVGAVDDESPSAELRRTLFSGTIWFAAAVIAAGIPLSGCSRRAGGPPTCRCPPISSGGSARPSR